MNARLSPNRPPAAPREGALGQPVSQQTILQGPLLERSGGDEPAGTTAAATGSQNTRFVLSSQRPFSVSFQRRILTGSSTLSSFVT